MLKKYKDKKQYRFKNYDYAQNGFYFVTICAKNREIFFGEIDLLVGRVKMKLSDMGLIAEKFWREIPEHFPFVRLDEFVIMPNHIHGIIEIVKENNEGTGQPLVGTGQCPVPTEGMVGSRFGHVTPKSLSIIIGSYKSIVTKTIKLQISNLFFAWQPRFHDRIIRNDDELNKIRQYIFSNPAKWERDRNNQDDLFM